VKDENQTDFNSAISHPFQFLTVCTFCELAALRYFWIAIIVAAWRFFFICESFSFWISLHTFVNPFKGFFLSKYARSMILAFLLHVELFLIGYVNIWQRKYKFVDCAASYFMIVGFILCLIYEVFPCFNFAKNKIKRISEADTFRILDFPENLV
jgi:hypothetical protein